MILTIDTFAWVEVIRRSPTGYRARDAIEGAEECFTPAIVLAEIASICARNGLPDSIIARELKAVHEASEVVPIEDAIAVAGAHVAEELRQHARSTGLPLPGLADGLVLATARQRNSGLLTGDLHFRACRETIWLA